MSINEHKLHFYCNFVTLPSHNISVITLFDPIYLYESEIIGWVGGGGGWAECIHVVTIN